MNYFVFRMSKWRGLRIEKISMPSTKSFDLGSINILRKFYISGLTLMVVIGFVHSDGTYFT